MINNKIKKCIVAGVIAGLLPLFAVADPVDDCLEMDGTIDDEGFCVVINTDHEPFARMVRAAGASGLGWVVVGLATTTTVSMYELALTPGDTSEVFVPGNPSLPGCQNANNAPKKCNDHYETVTNPDTYAWSEIFRESNTTYENISCLNPDDKDMGQHKQCGF